GGPGLYFAKVSVTDSAAPTASAQYVDPKHLVVKFSERMEAKKDAQVSLGSNVGVAKWKLVDSGLRLDIELAEPLSKNDTVRLSGFLNQAQQPVELKSEPEVRIPEWPSNPNKLVYWWEDATQNHFTVTPEGEIRRSELFRDGPPSGFDELG